MLKPQDVVVVLRLAVSSDPSPPSYQLLAAELGLSPSQVHAAVQNATHSGLLEPESRRVRRSNLLEFLLHGVKYVFPPERSGVTRGVPTSYAAPVLAERFSVGELPPVWPHPQGSVRGEGLAPLHRSVPKVALENRALYDVLALVDAIRAGRARERAAGGKLLAERLGA